MGMLYPIIIGQLFSLIGTSIQSMAIPLYILEEYHSGLLVGISQMITIVVTIIISPFAGVLGDRYNKKRLLMGSDLFSGVIVSGMFVLFSTGLTGLPFILACQALCAAFECMLFSSLFAILPDIVPEGELTRANALRGMGTGVALFAGPMVGGLIYTIGMKYIFLINALSFLLSALLTGFIRYRKAARRAAPGVSLRSCVSDLRDTLKYLGENAAIRTITRFAVILNLLSAPLLLIVIPYLLKQVMAMDSTQYGLIQGFYMVGFFVGGLVLSVFRLKDAKRIVRPALFVMTAATLLFSLVSLPQGMRVFGSMLAIVPFMLLIGCGDFISGTVVQSEIQASVRPDVISRVGGVLNICFQAAMPAGLLVVGLVIDHVPVYAVFIPLAVALAVFVAFFSGRLFKAGAQTTAIDL
jgi:MFS family permease